jgi:2-polyprenyl-6-hydroxyphenyl methylase/3-demethylubiquinone-9 3-methyltransferase
MIDSSHAVGSAIDTVKRFEFGENWRRFLNLLDDERIARAMQSLRDLLGVESLEGRRVLDIGSGSGLFSLAARRLGATVHSFDYDEQSVACTAELKRRYFERDPGWTIERGSVLDAEYVRSLGAWDIVYSWGVLHHTGAMWSAITNAASAVAPGGSFAIAIYNDQGWKSRGWLAVKWIHNTIPRPLKLPYAYMLGFGFLGLNIAKYTLMLKPGVAIRPLLQSKDARGMSLLPDMVDWIGGYPYEVATFERLQAFLTDRGFRFVRGTRATSLGCHEMVFECTTRSGGATA